LPFSSIRPTFILLTQRENPTWHTYLDFQEFEKGDKLYIKLYDADLTSDEFISSLYIDIDDLEYSPKVVPLFSSS
jgi:hypothetical protein